ncbi:MAG: EAL domain-containing protein [Pseudomonadota bacterium]
MIDDKQRRPVVVVADDDAATRYIVAETLGHNGFDVIVSATGSEALEQCRAKRPDIVLLDVEMPELDGYAVCEILRAAPDTRHVPLVVVTSHDDRDSIDRAYEAGATDFISKPISWPLLGHRLRYILRNSRNLHTLVDTLDENRALLTALPDNIFVVSDAGSIVEHLRGDAAPPLACAESPRSASLFHLLPDATHTDVESALNNTLNNYPASPLEFQPDMQEPGRWCECRFARHGRNRVLVILRDISERKRDEERIHRLAYYDALTGLPNRALFLECSTDALLGDSPNVAVFAIDLDRFKRINDTLGTHVGDATLVEVSRRLQDELPSIRRRLRSRDLNTQSCLACLGGNVFALMLAGEFSVPAIGGIAREVGQLIARPMAIGGHEFVITATVGVAFSPLHGSSVEQLLRNAEIARGEARSIGSNTAKVYRSSMDENQSGGLNLENELRQALSHDRLEVHYQPKVDARSGELLGAEALLRWPHADRGLIPPAEFIPVAEEAGLIVELGHWVVNHVCAQIGHWQRRDLRPGRIAVNLSGQEFVLGDPLVSLFRAVQRAGITAGDLELEITETVLMSDIRSVLQTLHRLRDAGFRLAVDDFGTGYSSLSYLQQFPVDVLKIDAQFVRHIPDDADSRAICKSIIALAHSLRLRVVGEGVETAGQQDFLRSAGCDVLQGFLVGKPMSVADYTAVLTSAAPTRATANATLHSVSCSTAAVTTSSPIMRMR